MSIIRHTSLSVTHPGVTLAEAISGHGLSKSKFADSIGISRQALHNILAGRNRISADIAVRLGHVFQPSAEFWLNRQHAYDLHQAKQRVDLTDIPTINELLATA